MVFGCDNCRTSGAVVAYSRMNPPERHRRLTGIFIAVCNLPEVERKQAVDDFCREYPELRAELDSLLTFHDKLSVAAEKGPPPSA
jgi:hypothetical protein